ncbi:MAG: hypothetical protein KF866_02675 [Phycisphaeraceae bacterium]|nr:hypothetical protein [Phycisphaeraceae bacterium]MCW5753399.1 hypothetical protein [Phycisphaeraceae bacterium]
MPIASLAGLTGVYLWGVAVLALLVSLLAGLCLLAGSTSRFNTRKAYLGITAVAVVVHAGYFAAPLAAGTSKWPWAFWSMIPLATCVLFALLASTYWPLRALVRSPEARGASLGGLVHRVLFALVFLGGVYIVPVIVVWTTRPT